MPMVPMYQGGVPSVVDSGQTGRQVAQLPNQTINYAKLMQDAQQPLQDFANNAGKALQTIAARNIKAESDEAEMKYMEAVQSRLYDPEAGYFNQKGKNAVDAYDGAMQGLKKDADDILGSLSPWAREAVQSRIQDRLRSAQGQSMQWMSRQRDAWHIGTSKARIDSLVESIGQNYGNKDYCGASYQSLDDEITALAKMQGLGEEQTKALREGYWDMAQAQRYSTWGQDDAVAALTDFQNNRGSIGSDVAAKIGTQLWQQAKQPLAMMLAGSVGETMLNKKDFIKESLKPGHRTGIPAIDGLNQSQKVELFSAAYSYAAQNRAAAQADLRTAVQNSLATAADQGYDENELSEEDFINAFGEKGGKAQYESYKRNFDASSFSFGCQYMDTAQIAETLQNAKPTLGSPTYAADKKRYLDMVKAASDVVTARQKDPVGAAIQTNQFGFEPLNFDNPEQMQRQLTTRINQAQAISESWGTPKAILSDGEAQQLVATLDNVDVVKRTQTLAQLATMVGTQNAGTIANQLGPKNQQYGTALYLMSGGDIGLGNNYLMGKDFMSQGVVQKPTTGDGSVKEILGYMQAEGKEAALSSNNDLMEMWADAAQGLWAYSSRLGNALTSKTALEKVLGGQLVEWNGKRIVTPYNEYTKRGYDKETIFATSFDDLLERKIGALKDDKTKVITGITGKDRTTVGAIAPNFKTMQLETISDGKYRNIDPNSPYGYVMQDLGNDTMTPYVLDVMDLK